MQINGKDITNGSMMMMPDEIATIPTAAGDLKVKLQSGGLSPTLTDQGDMVIITHGGNETTSTLRSSYKHHANDIDLEIRFCIVSLSSHKSHQVTFTTFKRD